MANYYCIGENNAMKKITILSTIVLLLGLLTGCGQSATEEIVEEQVEIVEENIEETEESDVEEAAEVEEPEEELEEEIVETDLYGNSIGNIFNIGIAAPYKDGIVFTDPYLGGAVLFTNGTDMEFIYPVGVNDINIWEDKLYAITSSETGMGNVVVQIDLNTKECNIIISQTVGAIVVANGDLYYIEGETGYLYRMDMDTLDSELVIEEKVINPVIYKDKIYYLNDDENDSLYCASLQGEDRECLVETHCWNPVIYKNVIYYSSYIDGTYSLNCINIDGTDEKELDQLYVGVINEYDGKLYYSDNDIAGSLFYIDLEGESFEPVEIQLEDEIKAVIKNDMGVEEPNISNISYTCFANGYVFGFVNAIREDGSSIEIGILSNVSDWKMSIKAIADNLDIDSINSQYTEWVGINPDEYNRLQSIGQ